MISIPVHHNQIKAYDIVLDDGVPFAGTLSHAIMTSVSDADRRQVLLVTDETVAPLYAAKAAAALERVFLRVHRYVLPAGERYKTLDEVRKIYACLIANGFDRHDVLCALGGGVIGDMTGFAAATYLRGVRFLQMPTTLLSQTDASIGGKTGVDFDGYKNIVGAFHMPSLVYIHPSVLTSLPDREYLSGMAEVIKHGLIRDDKYFTELKSLHDALLLRDTQSLIALLRTGCTIKRDVVERDPTEKGERALLNFGHTIGHAVEKAYDFRLLHGECVSLGSVAASYLSMRRGLIGVRDFERIKETFALYDLPVTRSDLPETDQILRYVKSDKKTDGGRVRFVLLKAIGDAFVADDVTDEEITDAVNILRATDEL